MLRQTKSNIKENKKIPCPACDGLSASPEESEKIDSCEECNSTGFVDAKVLEKQGGLV